ncbi:MAG: ankyrin repeat domain-containing protein [Planctomycetes bacterium]|nr:ankyrin repeat domain-containing protein [Planctomycetota bacterium]
MACEITSQIARGRTDLVFEFLSLGDWRDRLLDGEVKLLQWLVYFGDLTAIRAILAAGGDLTSIDVDVELCNAAFFGHWKLCDFLIARGANPNACHPDSRETALHSALTKAGRPAYGRVVDVLLTHGADPNARTAPGVETGAFMRDVRTNGETPLHRAAAFADEPVIAKLLEHGGDKEARDSRGDTPLSWASWHLRPGRILQLLAYGEHRVSDAHAENSTSDHGAGWGNGMERNLLGDFLPLGR